MAHLVEVTDVGDAADAEVAPRHVGRHRQQAVPIQLPVLHLKKKDHWALLEHLRFASIVGCLPKCKHTFFCIGASNLLLLYW